jgi:hypothetical protein
MTDFKLSEGIGPKSRHRLPCKLFDCVVEVFGFEKVTKRVGTRVGKIVAELKELGATCDDLKVRVAAYRRQFPSMPLTPEAMMKHWDFVKAKIVPKTKTPEKKWLRFTLDEARAKWPYWEPTALETQQGFMEVRSD